MGNRRFICKLSGKWSARQIGNKAESLLFLKKKSFPVPSTWILTADAFQTYLEEGRPFLEKLSEEIAILPDLVYAIRSSTNLEDSEKMSYAGQFRTELLIKGKARILQSILTIWDSSGSETEISYPKGERNHLGILRFAILIQEMVNPILSGVGFSRNPVTNLSEFVVEAVEGMGEELVQKGITPLRWRNRGQTLLEGDSNYPHFRVIQRVFSALRKLRKVTGKDVDIEWAYDGKRLWFLQMRSITGSAVQQVYSNRMAREMLPGQIKPLVWSVNIPLVNGTKIRILEEITGKLDVRPEQLAKAFHYRTYFNLAALSELFGKVGFSAESLEAMMTNEEVSMSKIRPGVKFFRHIFRFIRFIFSMMGFEKFYLREYKVLLKDLENLKANVNHDFSVGNYPVLYEAIFQAAGKAAYLNVFIPILMRFYDKKLRKKLASLKLEYGILDFNRDFPLLPSYSPHLEMEKVRKALDSIPPEIREKCETPDQLAVVPEAGPFLLAFHEFLQKFGHLSESGNDFSVEKWEENPGFMFQLIRKLPEQPSPEVLKSIHEINIPRIRQRSLLKSYGKAGRFRLYREQISSLYIFGYGLFRSLFLQMGDELVRAGILPHRTDVFFLKREEIDQILEKGLEVAQPDYAGMVEMRKKEMDDVKDVVLPSVIIGEEPPVVDRDERSSFRGVGTSPGRYTGKIAVISSIADFNRMEKGDVLVIPFSDVSWTPILVHAGAIISGAGGMLSHCSIIAREMSIPAIVSVDDALCLKDGMKVTVDGSNGIVTIYGDH